MIAGKHAEMMELFTTLRQATRHVELLGAERTLLAEGLRAGCFGATTTFDFEHGRVDFVPGGSFRFEDRDGKFKMHHHGSLWTSKTKEQRHREHITNCVKDSQAWKVYRSPFRDGVAGEDEAPQLSLEEVVNRVVEEFGGVGWEGKNKYYVRCSNYQQPGPSPGRLRSVKVFRRVEGEQRERQRDAGAEECELCSSGSNRQVRGMFCEAYAFLNTVLQVDVLHGP